MYFHYSFSIPQALPDPSHPLLTQSHAFSLSDKTKQNPRSKTLKQWGQNTQAEQNKTKITKTKTWSHFVLVNCSWAWTLPWMVTVSVTPLEKTGLSSPSRCQWQVASCLGMGLYVSFFFHAEMLSSLTWAGLVLHPTFYMALDHTWILTPAEQALGNGNTSTRQ